MAVSESEESLCSRIGGLKVENPPGERGDYIPRDKLDDLINHSTISSELQSEKIPFDENLLTYILKHAKLLFSIMVRTGSLEAAAKLPKLKLTDDYLPVQYAHGRVWSLKGAPMGDRPLDWFGRDVQNLTQKQHERWAGNFCSNQWIFLAPVFDDYEAVYPLQEKCPLPFTKYKGTQQRGATAFVAEAHIHPGHQKVTTQSDLVAIKNIDTEDRLLEKVVQLEVAALDFVRRLQHPHLIKFIASYSRVGRHHLMFEWADGGNLKDFWRTHHPDIPSRQQVIKWAVEQMTGLAGALDKLHNPGVAGLNCRHGDLKPANIVRTKERGSPHSLGHLQITDMGLAKVNDQLTRIRRTSGTFSTTERYQSPEFKFRRSYEVPTSRGYDIWSMGCILLELTVWLLYGGSGLDRFNHSFLGCFFAGDRGDYIELQPSVQNWISYMRNTALGDNPNQCVSKALAKLLNYIVDHLLVPDPRPPTELIEDPHFDVQITAPEGEVAVQFDRVRAKSQELLVVMEAIRNQGQRDPLYFFDDSLDSSLLTSLLTSPPTGYSRRPSASGLQVPDAERSQVRQSLHSTPWNANTQHPYIVEPMPDYWDAYPDNELALNVFPHIAAIDVMPLDRPEFVLCERCQNTNSGIFSNQFIFNRTQTEGTMSNCGICQALSRHAANATDEDQTEVRYVRKGSYLARHASGPPVFSIIVGPGISAAPNDLQRSFPKLPDAGSAAEFVILRTWIQDCDNGHNDCKTTDNSMSLPTRLIYVGDGQNQVVKLILSADLDRKTRYVALSHRWRYPIGETAFRLTEEHNLYKKWVEDGEEINFNEMPKTFRDAVTVTRGLESLNVHYLWIDSLCIIQDNMEDWAWESRRMRDVYNGAYCTIAATCAPGTKEGFLHQRPKRSSIRIKATAPRGKDAEIYICEAIDDFHKEVEKAELNTRGWVFQERALSRRILHFAERQVYMECGGGICCETTTRLFNRASFFLSDANFPNQAMAFYRGMKIKYYEIIYQQYSRRSFSVWKDRAVGMEGLESKILETYNTDGRFGVLHHYFHRSLMWLRDEERDPAMELIAHPDMHSVPTWSWMKVKGAIKYLPIDFEITDWSTEKVIKSPFRDEPGLAQIPDHADLHISAEARDFNNCIALVKNPESFFWDRPAPLVIVPGRFKCVIIGKQNQTQQSGLQALQNPPRLHYVLLIAPTKPDEQSCTEYERLGVAKLEGSYISLEGAGLRVKIV